MALLCDINDVDPSSYEEVVKKKVPVKSIDQILNVRLGLTYINGISCRL